MFNEIKSVRRQSSVDDEGIWKVYLPAAAEPFLLCGNREGGDTGEQRLDGWMREPLSLAPRASGRPPSEHQLKQRRGEQDPQLAIGSRTSPSNPRLQRADDNFYSATTSRWKRPQLFSVGWTTPSACLLPCEASVRE
ncbi:hypothetical protein MTO96_006665 [Rhipicephalus appendiculatus]